MESYHLDTSVVMRLLVQEPANQYIHAAVFLEGKLAAGASAKPGFADRLIHGTAVSADQTLVTFEKAAKNLPKVIVLGD